MRNVFIVCQGSSLPADFRLEDSSSSSGGIGFNDSMLSSFIIRASSTVTRFTLETLMLYLLFYLLYVLYITGLGESVGVFVFLASQSFSVDGLSRTAQAQIFSGPMFSSPAVAAVSGPAPPCIMRQAFPLPAVTGMTGGGNVLPDQQTTQQEPGAVLVDMSQSLQGLPVSSLAVPNGKPFIRCCTQSVFLPWC